jgi:hypothetical protein
MFFVHTVHFFNLIQSKAMRSNGVRDTRRRGEKCIEIEPEVTLGSHGVVCCVLDSSGSGNKLVPHAYGLANGSSGCIKFRLLHHSNFAFNARTRSKEPLQSTEDRLPNNSRGDHRSAYIGIKARGVDVPGYIPCLSRPVETSHGAHSPLNGSSRCL